MPRLLAVDDDTEVTALIAIFFSRYGFEVVCVESGEAMHRVLADQRIDIVLLDLGLPGEDGLGLVTQLRARWTGPVIIVSGRGETVDRVVGLEVGADDYVTKPFDLRELLARVKSVMRRAGVEESPSSALAGPSGKPEPAGNGLPKYKFENWTLDPGARQLTNGNKVNVELTRGEFDLLLALVERPQRVLSRDQLMEIIHNREAGPYDRTIDVQIGRLRRKIEDDPQQPRMIKAVRGLGYQFAAEVTRLLPGKAGHGR